MFLQKNLFNQTRLVGLVSGNIIIVVIFIIFLQGMTALHAAASTRNYAIVEWLINNVSIIKTKFQVFCF